MIRPFLAASLCAASLLTGVAQAEVSFKPLKGDPKEINFGLISTESSSIQKKEWMPLIADMEKSLGLKVKPFFAPDYAGVIEAMRFGKVHLAWFGNKSGMEAVDRSGGEVFAQTSKADGTQGYYSHIITQTDNAKINTLDDVLTCDKSLNFGIGDPNSTSGFLVPSYYVFGQNNVTPKDCFKTVRNANHETNLISTAHKQLDAAVTNSSQITRSKRRAPDTAAKIKVVWTSPLIPSDPMVYRKDLSKELKSRIKVFFLSYGRMGDTQAARDILANISNGLGLFMDSNNTQLYPIRQLALFKDKLKIEANKGLSDSEKAAKIAVIDKKLADLAIMVAAQ